MRTEQRALYLEVTDHRHDTELRLRLSAHLRNPGKRVAPEEIGIDMVVGPEGSLRPRYSRDESESKTWSQQNRLRADPQDEMGMAFGSFIDRGDRNSRQLDLDLLRVGVELDDFEATDLAFGERFRLGCCRRGVAFPARAQQGR